MVQETKSPIPLLHTPSHSYGHLTTCQTTDHEQLQAAASGWRMVMTTICASRVENLRIDERITSLSNGSCPRVHDTVVTHRV
jgi:hypothetical protein